MRLALVLLVLLLISFTGPRAAAQSLDLTIDGYGISLGDAEYVNGLRLNFRDRRLQQVNGINATVWSPYSPATGVVNGVSVGLPVTGAASVHGLATGLLGAGAEGTIVGVAVAPLGVGGGQDFIGIGVAGVRNVDHAADLRILVGGLGAGVGRDLTGLAVGGLGVGAGQDVTGLMVGGLGVGAGGDVVGILAGGLGVGAGGDLTGVAVGGLGVGGGGTVTGIMVGGLGVGAGEAFTGLAVGGVGVGAPEITGVVLSGVAAGGERVTGLLVAPAYVQIEQDGFFEGVSISAFNRIRGTQRGLTLGLFNFARQLHGVQIGLLNFAGNNPRGRRWLPVVNWNL